MPFRCDQGLIVKPEKTDEGFLRVFFRFRKVGEMPYLNADGSRHIEVVTRENLLNTDSLKTARQKPITQLHPPGKIVTPENAATYIRGMSGEAMLTDGDYTMLSGCVTHSELIDKILSGELSDVSSGYWSDKVPRNDGKFDQVNARYNHFAGVPYGRAGPTVNWFSADAAEPEDFAVQDIDTADLRLDKPILFVPQKRITMYKNIKLDDATTIEIGDSPGEQELAKYLSEALGNLAKQKPTVDAADTLKKEIETLAADRDQQQARADMAEAKVKEVESATVDEDKIKEAFESGKARAALEKQVAEITGAEVKADATDRDLRIAAIAKKLNSDAAIYAGKSDAYVDAAFDLAINADSTLIQRAAVSTPAAPTVDAMPMAKKEKKPLRYSKANC
jgi:uncharacterized protein